MSEISLKSITGITSITTPTGVDNQLTLHTNDTTQRVKVTQSGIEVVGVSTFQDIDVDGHTNLDNVSIVGVATLTSGSNQILFNTANGNIEITRASGGPFIDFKNSAAEDFDARIQSSGVGGRDIQIRASGGTGAWLGHANNSYDLGSSSVNWRHLYVTSVNAGVVTATTFVGNGDFVELDVDGHTNLDNVSIAGIVTATTLNYTGNQNLSHRNLVINGAMMVAQRGTSSTSTGYQTVDRFSIDSSGLNENLTQAQVDVASGTTPYTSGFRKALKITNGNQTGGAGNADYSNIQYKFEAQDVSNSGWNYISSSSDITISFWVKSSVAQTFYAYLRTKDGTNYHYPISFALSANTWTKVTKIISGNSNLQIDNDNGEGMQFTFMLFYGTNYTSSGATLNAWQTTSGNNYSPDNTTTWYTTNDATFEITGVQLEVGPVATPFEHLPHSENKRRCYRYCQRGRHVSSCLVGTPGTYYFSRGNINLFTPMRATVTGTLKAATWNSNRYFQYMTWSSGTNVTAAPASVTFNSGSITGVPDILSVVLHISISSGSSNSPLPANGPGSNNVYPIEYFDVLLEAEL